MPEVIAKTESNRRNIEYKLNRLRANLFNKVCHLSHLKTLSLNSITWIWQFNFKFVVWSVIFRQVRISSDHQVGVLFLSFNLFILNFSYALSYLFFILTCFNCEQTWYNCLWSSWHFLSFSRPFSVSSTLYFYFYFKNLLYLLFRMSLKQLDFAC